MATDKTTVKSYDQYTAKCAEKMREGRNTKHTFLEKPAMYKKLPDLKGKAVLCLGCGTAEECEYIKSLGAKRVVGIDISKERIKFVKKMYPGLEFYAMDIENLKFDDNSFDFVYSSLMLHYSKDWTKLLSDVYRILKKRGTFLFSTHHPVKWGAETKKTGKKRSFLMGYEKLGSNKHKIFGDYLNARKVTDTLSSEGLKVTYYHRSLSEIMRDIRESSFTFSDFVEPKPLRSSLKENPDFYEIHSKIPLYMIFELKKG